MQDENPYAAPAARVADVTHGVGVGALIDGGRPVASSESWQWIVHGFELFKRNPGVWILILILLFAMLALLSSFSIGAFIVNLIYPVFGGGVILGCHAQANGEPLEVAHLFAGFREKPGQLLLVGLLYMAGMLAIFFVVSLVFGIGVLASSAGGLAGLAAAAPLTVLLFVLVFVAVLLPLTMAIWFAPALVVLHDLSAVDAMKQSFRGCWKNMIPFLVYGLIVLGLGFVASIPIFLGWLVLAPTLMASNYYAYRDIFVNPA